MLTWSPTLSAYKSLICVELKWDEAASSSGYFAQICHTISRFAIKTLRRMSGRKHCNIFTFLQDFITQNIKTIFRGDEKKRNIILLGKVYFPLQKWFLYFLRKHVTGYHRLWSLNQKVCERKRVNMTFDAKIVLCWGYDLKIQRGRMDLSPQLSLLLLPLPLRVFHTRRKIGFRR